MLKRMSYSLWKNYYRSFPADQYDQGSKTILVELPDTKQTRFPKEWKRIGNSYRTPGGCTVYFWNTGLARNYLVEKFVSAYYTASRSIHPGVDSHQKVVNTVKQFETLYPAP